MRIGIDLDDVVADSVAAMAAFHNERYGTSLKREDFVNYDLWKIWGGDRLDAIKKIEEFFLTDHFANISPVAGSVSGIAALKGMGHELYAVTARSDIAIRPTEVWIKKHFPDAFRGVHFANHFNLHKEPRKKSEICKELGIGLLIDDSMENAKDCAAANIKVFLLDYPWNQGDLPDGVKRVFSWEEIVSKLS
jgi:uncharacterized HAD superfamily protein